MSNIKSIWDGKLAKRRHHNAVALSLLIARGAIPPRTEAALAGVLHVLREQCRNLANRGV